MKHMHLIAYDITRNKTRNRVAELLEQYGTRINLSVFECMITHRQKQEIIRQISELINPKTDSVRIYFICSACYAKSIIIGRPDPPDQYMVFV